MMYLNVIIVLFSLAFIVCLILFLRFQKSEFKTDENNSPVCYFFEVFLLLAGVLILFYSAIFGTYFAIKLLLKVA